MFKFQFFARRCVLVFLLIIACGLAVSAQSTIFNIPSTDILPEGSTYLEADVYAHFDKYKNGGFRTYGYRIIRGIKRRFEVGANFFFTRNGENTPKEFQPNLKYKIYDSEKYGIAVTTGAMFFIPLDRWAGRRTYGMFYSNASKIVKPARDMRLTGGIYAVAGAERDFGTKTGAIIGIEQPIYKKLNFAADWYSGKNRFGYSAAGLSYPLTHKQFLMVGYNFGNTGRGNNAFSAFYGYTF